MPEPVTDWFAEWARALEVASGAIADPDDEAARERFFAYLARWERELVSLDRPQPEDDGAC